MRANTMDHPENEIYIEPIISYPRLAEPGKTYLMTVDLKPVQQGGVWPYGEEEYVVHCHVNAGSLFEVQQQGETDIVVHRFGGTYGPATFLLTAASEEQRGHIDITLVNGWGVPIDMIELSEIQVAAREGRGAETGYTGVIDSIMTSRRDMTVAVNTDAFGELLGIFLVRFDRSRAWLAKTLGVNLATVSDWVSGHKIPGSRDKVLDLVRTLMLGAEDSERLLQAAGYEPMHRGPAPDAKVYERTSHGPSLDPAVVAAYLEIVRQQYGSVGTRPYRQLSELRGAPSLLPLLDENGHLGVYVPLRFDLHSARPAREGLIADELTPTGRMPHNEELRDLGRMDIGLAELLASRGHMVFVGAAGCGKTTVLRLVATTLAQLDTEAPHRELGVMADPLPLPVYLALRDFEHACVSAPATYGRDLNSLLRFLDDHFARWHPGRLPAGFLSGLVKAGRAWLLLDALDEVADFDHRIAVRQAIEKLADAFPGNRLLVTARVTAYTTANTRLDERFHVAAVRALTRDQWTPMIKRLYAGLEASPNNAARRTRRLLAQIDAAPQLQEMVKTPLMAWTATLIHYADRELPEQRAELYRAYVDMLLGERLHEEESEEATQRLRDERWSMDDRLLYLTYAAYQAHEGAEKRRRGDQDRAALVVVDEDDLVKRILAPFMAKNMMLSGDRRQAQRRAEREASEFLAFMTERSGLLNAHPEGYSFGDHLTMQEYLAANYLVDNVRGSADWLDFLASHAGQSWWQEVFLLMAGHLLRRSEQARRFVLDELGALPGDGDAHAYGLAWAGRALLEVPPRRVSWHDSARDELARRLVRVLWQNPPPTSVAARVEVGDVLGHLGDPRFSGLCLLPEFVSIAAGRFWMGSDEVETSRLLPDSKESPQPYIHARESPRHPVDLDSFAIARYPTTNAMFGRFMEAGGYAEQLWWHEAKTHGRWLDGKVLDRQGSACTQPACWNDAGLNSPNQPVVGVTWYEAVAYCRWLTATLADGHVYRLPTEAEWERAARGPDNSRYPWGDEWYVGRANSGELGLERTTPVGIFPEGASSEGVLDLSGNVWEWCSDWFDEQTYRHRAGGTARNPTGPALGQSRVLRGGSWSTLQNAARCASRSRNFPDVRVDDCGFRVVRKQPINSPSGSELAKLQTLRDNLRNADKIKSAWEEDPFIPASSVASYLRAKREFNEASDELDSFLDQMRSRYPDHDFKYDGGR